MNRRFVVWWLSFGIIICLVGLLLVLFFVFGEVRRGDLLEGSVWDSENRFAEIVIEGKFSEKITGFDLVFVFGDGDVVYYAENKEGLIEVRCLDFGNALGELEYIKLIPVFSDGVRGDVISEISADKIRRSDLVNEGQCERRTSGSSSGGAIGGGAGGGLAGGGGLSLGGGSSTGGGSEGSGGGSEGGGDGSGEVFVCTPNCDGKQCGSDGCTGSCGDCGGGEYCGDGECIKGDVWYVSHLGGGSKNGTNYDNSWAGWSKINWSLIKPGDTVYVIGIIRGGTGFSISNSVNGNSKSPIYIRGHPLNPGILYEGIEYGDSDWIKGEFNSYYRYVNNCNYNYIREWTSNPLDFKNLLKRNEIPNNEWMKGSYYCEGTKILHYRPTDDVLVGKSLTVKWHTIPSLYLEGDYIYIKDLTILHGIRIGSRNPANYITLDNCTIRADYGAVAIRINTDGKSLGSNNGVIKNCDISEAKNGIYLINQAYDETHDNHNWTIKNNKIYNIIELGGDSHAIGIQGGDNHLLEYNELYNAGSGITFWTQPSRIFFRNGTHNFTQGEAVSSSSGGFATVAYRTYSLSGGLWEDGSAFGNVKVYNFSGEWNDGDIIIGTNGAMAIATGNITRQTLKDAIVRYNLVYNMSSSRGGNGRGIEYSGDHSENELVSGGRVYRNILFDIENAALRIKATENAGWIFNNNIVVDSGTGLYSLGSNYVLNKTPDFFFINNILINSKNGVYYIHAINGITSNSNIRNNLYYPDGKFYWAGVKNNISDWQMLGFDRNTVVSNPHFIDVENRDFRLRPDSPAIDAGVLIPGIHCETSGAHPGKDCVEWYGSAPDIGAYEYIPEGTVQSTQSYSLFSRITNVLTGKITGRVVSGEDEARRGDGLILLKAAAVVILAFLVVFLIFLDKRGRREIRKLS
jgi:hypothetical protein